MLTLGNKSKFVAILSQAVRCTAVNNSQVRGYAEYKGDEDIKWQWSVREPPCGELCGQYKDKRSWISKILRTKRVEGLTNRHKEIKYVPKIWELEYYNYLLPDYLEKESVKVDQNKLSHKTQQAKHTYPVCGPKNYECEGKQIFVSLEKDNEFKLCTKNLNFQYKDPFCLNEVCGKMKLPKEEKSDEDKPEFLCLNNHLIKNKEKLREGEENENCDK